MRPAVASLPLPLLSRRESNVLGDDPACVELEVVRQGTRTSLTDRVSSHLPRPHPSPNLNPPPPSLCFSLEHEAYSRRVEFIHRQARVTSRGQRTHDRPHCRHLFNIHPSPTKIHSFIDRREERRRRGDDGWGEGRACPSGAL